MPADQTPPHNTNLEQELIALLISQRTPAEGKHWIAQKITPGDFYHGPHQVIFEECMGQLLKDGKVIYALLKDRLAGHKDWDSGVLEQWLHKAYLNTIRNMDDYRHVPVSEYCERLRAYTVARKATVVALTLARKLSEESAMHAAEFASQAALDLAEVARGHALTTETEPTSAILSRAIATVKGEIGRTTYPTGLIPLDDRLSGGYEPGSFNVIAARRSVGKSALALHLGVTWARAGHNVVYLSQEMTRGQLLERALCMVSGVPLRNRYGVATDAETVALASAADEVHGLPLTIDDARVDLAGLRSKVHDWWIKGQMDVLIIDHLQKIALHRAESNQRALADITAGLKDIANTKCIPVILMSQIRREGEYSPKIPNLSCLKGSGSIEEDADTVLLLWPGRTPALLCAAMEKNRFGATGSFDLSVDFSRMRVGVAVPGEERDHE